MLKIYGVPTCDKIRKTQSLLKENNIEFIFVNVRKEPISKAHLKKIVDVLGLELVLNKKGMLYRKLGLKDKTLDNQQLFDALFNEQGMIKRPLMELDGNFRVGFDTQEILGFVHP